MEQFLTQLNDFFIWKFNIDFVLLATLLVCLFNNWVLCDIAVLLFDFLNEFLFIGLVKLDLSGSSDQCTEGLGESTTSNVVLADGDLVNVSVNDWDCVANSITHVEYSSGGLTSREQ